MKTANSLITGVIIALTAATLPANSEELRIGTASQGGAFYPVGQAISTLVTKYAKDLEMVPIVTQGSVQNPKLVNIKEVDLGITNKKDGKMNLRAIGALHYSVLHMMTLKSSAINTVADLKGKRIAVGPAGGGTIPFLKQVLGVHGLKMEDITPSFLSYADGFSQLSDGNVDAAFALSGYPAGAVMQARVNKELKFIKFSDGKVDEALGKYKNYNKVVVPKTVYRTDEDGVVLGVNNMLITSADMDADKVYEITKAIYDHMDEFRSNNAHANQINVSDSLSLKIPLHPGAARYFKK
jgi:hypothetical protein